MIDTLGSTSTIASSSSSSSPPSETSKSSKTATRNSRKLFGSKDEKRRQSEDVRPESPASPLGTPNSNHHDRDDYEFDPDSSIREDSVQEDPPVIVEPVNIPRPRTRSDRPLSDNYPSSNYYPSSSSGTRIADLPTRLSGWFSHTFSTSATDLTLPALLSQQQLAANNSPKGKTNALLTAAKHGQGHLSKAMRFLLDSDATPDNCPDSIWILGLEHPGYEPSSPSSYLPPGTGTLRRGSINSKRHQSPASIRSSPSSSPTLTAADPSLSQSQPASSNPKDPGRHWPPVFYSDFTSRIWLTYRNQFQPIRDTSLEALEAEVRDHINAVPSSPPTKKWNWPLGGEKAWSSDSGWGCMLRTGQSLLANALLHLHLGRDWRRPPYPVYTADYATYVQIVTWFLDDPSPQSPFSVHRMALVGKALGVRVGQWFGPSTAAGAIKTLVRAFPQAGLGVYVAADGGTIYESEVFEASHSTFGAPKRYARRNWGDRAVLVLIGHRLGIDGVNPVYYDTLKTLYTWPQSVGIAGGRPSSSYYFVGSQADNLFYLDPHHARPAIPLRPLSTRETSPPPISTRQTSPEPFYSSDRERERERDRDKRPRTPHRHVRSPTSPASARSSTSGNSSFSHRAPMSPSPLQQQLSSSSAASSNSESSHARWHSSVLPESDMDSRELDGSGVGDLSDLDPVQRHFVTAYSAAELKTFHCDRVRKMPLSGLDPSMLMGFLCKNEQDWIDFKAKVADLNSRYKATVLSIQDEPPNWPSDSEMGLESISEPDIDMPEDEDELLGDGSSSEQGRSRSASVSSPDTSVSAKGGAGSGTGCKSEGDTEEDPIDPITPGPGRATFETSGGDEAPEKMKREESTGTSLDFDDEDDEEWVDPEFTPQTPSPAWTWTTPSLQTHDLQPSIHIQAPPIAKSRSALSTASLESDPGASHVKLRKSKKSSSSQGTISRSHSRREKQGSTQSYEQYPFPAAGTDPADDDFETTGKRVPQMRTAKARDGGRTQSGGVRGVPTDDFDDF
ncbi:Cysteine protease atg4 [Steccherinum ochraceum]|uniref:Autophagy-related protein 4 n=1 Tax=Steccherinum ochraceum TaxID=92696 RepID=A0A4V2MVH6_9APHY|nr:Cysteine protease atg4 [Steccherinum ochraceum]